MAALHPYIAGVLRDEVVEQHEKLSYFGNVAIVYAKVVFNSSHSQTYFEHFSDALSNHLSAPPKFCSKSSSIRMHHSQSMLSIRMPLICCLSIAFECFITLLFHSLRLFLIEMKFLCTVIWTLSFF